MRKGILAGLGVVTAVAVPAAVVATAVTDDGDQAHDGVCLDPSCPVCG